MAKLEGNVTQVERNLFSSIYIDKLFIHIGNTKEKISNVGLYNQVCHYFNNNRKLVKFLIWLCEEFNAPLDDNIPIKVIEEWEKRLILATKTLLYTEVLRVEKDENGCYTFYAVKDQGSELRYLCNMELSTRYMSILRQFLKYNDICHTVCERMGLEHPMDKTSHELNKDIESCIRYKLIPFVNEVKVLSNDKSQYCLAYYDLKQGNPKRRTTAWDSFMSTMPDDGTRECFMAYLYGLFKGDNFGKQMLWIHGKGDSGKSKVVQTIKKRMEKINSNIVTALAPTFFQDKFSSISHTRKRLVIAQDCADRSLVRNQLVKNITGNDDTNIRGMGTESKHANVYSKLVVSSNVAPWINPNKPEELSRMLYIHLDPELSLKSRTKWEREKKGDWVKRLEEEIDDFIAKCETYYYQHLMPDGHNIQPYPTMTGKLTTNSFIADNLELWFETCLHKFKPTPDMKTNVIYFEELCYDYKRFLGKPGQNPRYARGIGTYLIPFLLEHNITIHTLTDVNNSKYIVGYDYVEQNPKERLTLEDALKRKAYEIGVDGKPTGVIFAERDPEDQRGWGRSAVKP